MRLVRAGFTPQVHAIGDRAVRATLDDYAVVRDRGGTRPRLAIAHAELVDPADYGRFKALDVTPVMSFQWGKPAPDSIDAAKVFMGPERFDRMEPEGRLQDAGARVAFGSDWPVDALNEFFAVEVGVTRRNDPASGYAGRLNCDPGLTRKEAFRAITTHSASVMAAADNRRRRRPGRCHPRHNPLIQGGFREQPAAGRLAAGHRGIGHQLVQLALGQPQIVGRFVGGQQLMRLHTHAPI